MRDYYKKKALTREELTEFLDCVKTRRTPKVDGNEGKRNLEVVSKILEKMKETG